MIYLKKEKKRLEAAIPATSNSVDYPSIPPNPTRKADWDLWKFIPHCELWKAVALSLDIEPPTQLDRYNLNIWPKEFFQRCKIAYAHFESGNLELSKSSSGGLIVDLPAFSAWARSLDFSLPDQFLSIIEPDQVASKTKPDNEIVNTETLKPDGKNSSRKRGKTKITLFLTELCQHQDINTLSAENLVRSIRPLVGKTNCPVKKYHGWHDEVCVEWNPRTGSPKGSWGKKAFQNFVSDYRKATSKKPVNKII